MDLLGTRAREEAFVRLCLHERQRFVVDATNPRPADRRRYVEPAREAGFKVVGYLVEVADAEALARNAGREGRRRVPVTAVVGTGRRLLRPTPEEGFDELWHATAATDGGWRIEPLLTTPPLPGL
jgi:predicted kinase